ncbi:MAG: right-handed parallel beta-helix repeat-containing protein [Bacteroidota bacterium]
MFGYTRLADIPPDYVRTGWPALDDLRYVGTSKDIRFEYYDDLTALPALMIREDSWFDAAMDGFVFAPALTVTNGATLTIEDGITLTFDEDLIVEAGARLNVGTGVELRFAPGKRIVNSGDFDADGVVFTPDLSTSGWSGIRYEPGSTGTMSGSVVEGVSGWGSYAVRINNASPTITGSQIRDSASPSASGGMYVTGSNADPYLFQNSISNLTSYGVVITGLASTRLRTNSIVNNTGEGLLVGAFSEALVYGENTFTSNTRDGIEAARGQVYLGRYYYPTGGYHADGYNVIEANGTHGLYARNQGFIGAGNSNRGRYNTILSNIGDEARASGTSSSVLASTNWWGQPVANDPGSVLTTTYTRETSSGSISIVDVCDTEPGPDLQFGPPSNDPPGCLNPQSTSSSFLRMAGGSAASESQHQRYGLENWDETVVVDPWRALDHLDAIVREGGADVASAFAEMVRVADYHNHPGWLDVAEPDAPRTEMPPRVAHDGAALRASTRDRLEAYRTRERTEEQAWASVALIGTYLREGDADRALKEADELLRTVEGLSDEDWTAVVGFAYAAQVYTRAEAGDVKGAEAALAAWQAATPDDPEVALAADRLAMAKESTGNRVRVAPEPAVRLESEARPEAFQLGAPYPNPAGETVTVPLALPEAAGARVIVYDVLGRTVAVLAEGRRDAGTYDLTVATRDLAAGVYVVRVVSESSTAVQTFTVAR